jgi:hypothetical protein
VNFGDAPITDAIASLWFAQDWQDGYATAHGMFPAIDTIDQVRRESLIWILFNMGQGTLSQFVAFIQHVNAGEWPEAAFHVLTNMAHHLTPYVQQVGARAEETGLRIATGEVLLEFRA